jgi:hypothetical protein
MSFLSGSVELSCCRFDGHQDWVFHEAGAGFQGAIANEGICGTTPRPNPAFPTESFFDRCRAWRQGRPSVERHPARMHRYRVVFEV